MKISAKILSTRARIAGINSMTSPSYSRVRNLLWLPLISQTVFCYIRYRRSPPWSFLTLCFRNSKRLLFMWETQVLKTPDKPHMGKLTSVQGQAPDCESINGTVPHFVSHTCQMPGIKGIWLVRPLYKPASKMEWLTTVTSTRCLATHRLPPWMKNGNLSRTLRPQVPVRNPTLSISGESPLFLHPLNSRPRRRKHYGGE